MNHDLPPACGHAVPKYGSPVCEHLRDQVPGATGVRWYTGNLLESEVLCAACCDRRAQGDLVIVERLCKDCYVDLGPCVSRRGTPGTLAREEPFATRLIATRLPDQLGTVIDLVPVTWASRAHWLLLTESGHIARFDPNGADCPVLAQTMVPAEPEREPWAGHVLRRRLHASSDGRFAAVVNDYGQWGEVLDLLTSKVTMRLDGKDYHADTVPFALAFARMGGRDIVIHRTDWNRLDVSDPRTGELLTPRQFEPWKKEGGAPAHYLDYFFGELHVSPSSRRVASDGWVWHPVGVPYSFSLERWLTENPYEPEDGSSAVDLCYRGYYWDTAFAWIDDTRLAIEGIGEDDDEMVAGARIFDVTFTSTRQARLASSDGTL